MVDGTATSRPGYHHGNLRQALIVEGLALARLDGPTGVSLREVTRAAGVAVNAAYRHFADREDFLGVVAMAAQRQAALAIERVLVVDRGGRERLRSVGRGYVGFAITEPGWFRTAFTVPTDLARSAAPEAAGDSGRTPFQLLSDALDALVDDGELDLADRPLAEVPCWSAVHGFASLILLGPLRGLPREMVDGLAERTVDVAVSGLLATTKR